MRKRIRHHKLLTVWAERPSFGKETGEPRVALGEIGGAGVHHTQAKPLDLFRAQALTVKLPGLVLVAGEVGGFGERVYRVTHCGPQPFEFLLPGQLGVMGDDLRVGLELRHPHVLDPRPDRRNPLGCDKYKQVTVEQPVRGDHFNFGHRVVSPRQRNLVHLKFPAGSCLFRKVADADRGDHILPEQLQSG